MKQLEVLIKDLAGKAETPKKTILASMEKHGKKAIGCLPIYAPEEIIYAAGYIPVGLWGGNIQSNKAGRYYPQFCCSIVRNDTELAMAGHYDFLSAVVPSAFCDTLKCAVEVLKVALPEKPVLPFVYPQNRKTEAGREYLIAEYHRFQKELETLSGKTVTEDALLESWEVYRAYREKMRRFVGMAGKHTDLIDSKTRHRIIKAACFMDKKEYAGMIHEINEGLAGREETPPAEGKVVLTGLLSEPVELLDILNENGLYVVADDLAQESRQFRTLDTAEGDVYQRLARRFADQDGCTFLYDECKSRLDVIKKLVKDTGADMVVYLQMKFCDPEEFDRPVIEKGLQEAGIPVLYIETEQQMEALGQLTTRIQGFREAVM